MSSGSARVGKVILSHCWAERATREVTGDRRGATYGLWGSLCARESRHGCVRHGSCGLIKHLMMEKLSQNMKADMEKVDKNGILVVVVL